MTKRMMRIVSIVGEVFRDMFLAVWIFIWFSVSLFVMMVVQPTTDRFKTIVSSFKNRLRIYDKSL